MDKKFIKTIDKSTADKLIAAGFKLFVQTGNIYTFLNQPPKNFNFDEIDKKLIVYDNILSI
jgi:hypothetical protein